mmetsp:Transcript_53082/g.95832  ORF Transcript_53082/g.95832 Transcript_53082/m.95832 type:complete len:81 (-) Transcript_53082:395-637(-)
MPAMVYVLATQSTAKAQKCLLGPTRNNESCSVWCSAVVSELLQLTVASSTNAFLRYCLCHRDPLSIHADMKLAKSHGAAR